MLKGVFQFGMRVILIGISRDVEYDLRNDLFKHLTGLAPDYYARTRTGDIMARATNDLNAVRMMLGPGLMYWGETSLTFILAISRDVEGGLASGALRHDARAGGQPGDVVLRPCDPRPLREDSGDVFRYLQPRAGESLRRAHGAGVRAGEGRNAPFRRS